VSSSVAQNAARSPEPPSRTAARGLIRLGRPYARPYAAGLVLLLATNALALSIPLLLREAIDRIEAGATLRTVSWFAAAIAAVAVVQALVRTGSRLVLLGASRRIAYDVRTEFFRRLQRMGATFYDTHRIGDVMSRGVNDVQLLRGFFGPGVMNLLNTAIVYVATTILMFRIDVRLTLWSLALVPLLLVVVNRISRRVYHRSKAVQEQLAEVSNRVQENVSGIQQVKTFVQEDREIAGFRDLCEEFRRRNLDLVRLRGWMIAFIGVFSGLGTLVVLFLGGRAVITGRITFGDFVAFNTFLAQLTWPTVALGWIINTFQRGVGAMERIDAVLSAEPDVPSPVDEVEQDPAPGPAGDIEARGLTFTYPGADRPALRDVDLSIPRGSRVALVGPVGSGKSTLVNLLARFYPVERGQLFVDGRDVNDVPVSVLRGSLAYVPQEAFLFSRTIRDNVTLGEPEADEDAVLRAVGLSRLSRDLESFPAGLDTRVGERGVTLSGGQRQRTTLARAAIGTRSILVLDDSLSAVDADTEREILDELRGLMEGRTTIFVTHRFSNLVDVDRIVVLDDGAVVEQGSHDELLERDGVYAHLFRKHRLEERLEASP
jgi:ATP-binding cassette subfamily B protein